MIYRIDVRSTGADPHGHAVAEQIRALGLDAGDVRTVRIFLVDADAPRPQLERAAAELLADPVVEAATLVDPAHRDGSPRIEVHLKPGVMDPVADSTEAALRDMGLTPRAVRTGRAYLLAKPLDREQLQLVSSRLLANAVVEHVFFDLHVPERFATAPSHDTDVRRVPLRSLSEDELKKLSRDGHLFLSPTEMLAIQDYFRAQDREPTDIELETIAQTWSEHCVHKTLKSRVTVVDETGRELRRYDNLIKQTIFGATQELIRRRDDGFCLSVFKDNAGVIAFDETDAVCFKVETHNHPSAIEPYGGSATGIGGCIRDVLGTGLAAKPVANTDTFCVAFPERDTPDATTATLPPGVIHPKRILRQIVAGVRDYGNRMGIPTVNGAVYFDERYLGNPLVFAGCVGIIPRDKIHKESCDGDAIVVIGGRTGRDGIHGATFSSAELTDTHVDEFSHAVQIGNAITQKKMMDVLLQARDRGLYTAVTDCGAGGLSSAVGEMGAELGAVVELDRVPLKYAGLRYDEIWISEAQERMVLSVPPQHVDALLALAAGENVEATVLGTFGHPQRELVLNYHGREVGRLAMAFLHDGIPMPQRIARVSTTPAKTTGSSVSSRAMPTTSIRERLLATLAHPNVASKHWVVRQYDHEVQGGSVVKPLVGPLQIGPSDASVLRPKLSSMRGVLVSAGLAPWVEDPYEMALAAIDEAIRNAICVGGSLETLAILDNFCWPSVDDEVTMGTLVRACEGCRDASLAYGVPFISGKDSLHNQFTIKETGQVIRIPRTLLISAIGVIGDVRSCLTMDLKTADGTLCRVFHGSEATTLEQRLAVHRAVQSLIAAGLVRSAHDVSDGGWLTAAAEMAIASGRGLAVHVPGGDAIAAMFAERPATYLLELDRAHYAAVSERFASLPDLRCEAVARVVATPALTLSDARATLDTIPLADLTRAWRGTLDW